MKKLKIEKFKTETYKRIPLEVLQRMLNETPNGVRKFYAYVDSVEILEGVEENYKKYLNFPASFTDYLYNEECISLKYNVSIERAKEIIEDKKSSKATSLKGFIKRWGEEIGKEKFAKFQKTSKAPHEWLFEVSEEERLNFRRKHSVRCFEFYIHRGYTDDIEEAKKLASENQINNAGVNTNIYKTKGYSDSEIDEIIDRINLKKGVTLEDLKVRYPDTWRERHIIRVEKFRNTTSSVKPEDYNIRDAYYGEVNKITSLNWILYKDRIENSDIFQRSENFHLDHMISKNFGFLNGIPPEIIGHPCNLKLIPRIENCSKRANCSITLEELENKIKDFE